VSPEQIVGLVLGGTSIGSGVFWTGITFGRILARVERAEERLAIHAQRLDDHDDEFRVIKGLPVRSQS